jgi:aminoglycoside phosphotransferase (APT) family kinase protein
MTDLDDTRNSLTELLSTSGVPVSRVEITGSATLGAQRSSLFINIYAGPNITEAVAQILAPGGREVIAPENDAAVLRLARKAGAPVAHVLAASNSAPVTGAQAIVVSKMAGESIPRKILRDAGEHGTGDELAADLGAALARAHAVPVAELPTDFERHERGAIHQAYCALMAQNVDEVGVPHPAARLGIHWLRQNLPSLPSSPTLVHGDLRNGNILVNRGRLSAMIDWELAHIGDPMEDLAWLCLRTWRFGNDDLEVGGFGSLASLRSAYEAAGGEWREDAFRWWTVARTVWWANGLNRQVSAALDGLSDSIVLAASGRRVVEQDYDLLRLIAP